MKGLVFDIKRFALHDGPGIRTTVFLKGCPLNCLWCHNPESKNEGAEVFETTAIVDKQTFCGKRTIGRYYQSEELIKIVVKDEVFFRESGGGVTLSGGEPLLQHDFSINFLKACKARGLHTILDTSGYTDSEIIIQAAQFTDLFLYDLKMIDNELHKQFTGVDNHSILSNLRLLDRLKKKIIIRIPMVEKVNATTQNLSLLINFLSELTQIREIHLLPYHNWAENKHKKYGALSQRLHFNRPDNDCLAFFQNRLTDIGYRVKIGG